MKKIKIEIKKIEIVGLRQRIIVSFLSVVLLLLFSGMISFFELKSLSVETSEILQTNKRNIELTRDILSQMQMQNMAFTQMTILNNTAYDTLYVSNIATLEKTIEMAKSVAPGVPLLDSISNDVFKLRMLAHEITTAPYADYSSRSQYYSRYKVIYDALIANTYEYMTLSQTFIEPRAEALYHNAYRAVTPVLISLAVMIAIVLMLLYFVLLYVVNPILNINRSLNDYLTFRLPFSVKSECKDEVEQLKDNIDNLIAKSKKAE